MSKKLKFTAGLLLLSSPLVALFISPNFTLSNTTHTAEENLKGTDSDKSSGIVTLKLAPAEGMQQPDEVSADSLLASQSAGQSEKTAQAARAESTANNAEQAVPGAAENNSPPLIASIRSPKPFRSDTSTAQPLILKPLKERIFAGKNTAGKMRKSPTVVDAHPVFVNTVAKTDTIQAEYIDSTEETRRTPKEIPVTDGKQVYSSEKKTLLTSEIALIEAVKQENSRLNIHRTVASISRNIQEKPQLSSDITDSETSQTEKTLPSLFQPTPSSAFSEDTLNDALLDEIIAASDNLEKENQPSGGNYVTDRLSEMARRQAADLVTNETEQWLNVYGISDFSLTLNEKFQAETYSFDYLLPVTQDETSMFFSQLGARNWQNRNIINFGLGYRHFLETWMLGANAFLDSDLTYGHKRAGIGFEAAADFFRWSGNYYLPVTKWQSQDVGNSSFDLQARAAEGYDTALTAFLPAYPQLSTTIEHFRWFGDAVDQDGGFHKGASVGSWKQMMQASKGYNVSLGWQPIPLISTSLNRTLSEQVSETSLTMNLTYNFDQPIEQQLQQENVRTEALLSGMRRAMVKRNNNMVLAYRSNPLNPLKVEITLPQSVTDMTPGSVKSISAKLKAPVPIETSTWVGNGREHLTRPEKLDTEFIAPEYNPNGNNRYTLAVHVTDITNNTATSNNIVFNVVESLNQNLKPVFYTDAAKSQTIDVTSTPYSSTYNRANNPNQQAIFWQYGLNQSDPKLAEALKNCNQDATCTAVWQNDRGILETTNAAEPVISAAPVSGIGQYQVTLTAKVSGYEDIVKTIPIEITPANTSDIAWQKVENGGTLPITYRQDLEVNDNAAVSDLYPNTTITYSVEYPEGQSGVIGPIDNNTGSFDVLKPGQAILSALHHSADRYFEPTTISYTLDVLPAEGGIVWHDERANNGLPIKESYSQGHTITITAEGPAGTDISYEIDPSADPDVASVSSDTGTVLIKKSGSTRICAEANFGLFSFSDAIQDCYTLEIIPGSVDLNWISVNPENGEYRVRRLDEIDSSAAITNPPDDGKFSITYSSSKNDAEAGNVVSVKADGTLELHNLGDEVITASLTDASGRYQSDAISYQLLVEREPHPNNLTWKDPKGLINQGTVEVTFNDEHNNQITTITLANTVGDGEFFYYPTNALPDAVTVDEKTGKVTIIDAAPNFVISAKQLAGSIYEESQSIIYTLRVNEAPNNGLTWSDGKPAEAMRCVAKSEGKFRLTADGSNNTSSVRYELTQKPDGTYLETGATVNFKNSTDFNDPITVQATQDRDKGISAITSSYSVMVKESCP